MFKGTLPWVVEKEASSFCSSRMYEPFETPKAVDWLQLIEATITSREGHLTQLQHYCTGLRHHKRLIDKDGKLNNNTFIFFPFGMAKYVYSGVPRVRRRTLVFLND